MPGTEKLSITLTPKLAALIHEAVATGDYASTSEVVREALRDWRRKRLARQQRIQEILHMWEEGIQSGPGRFQDLDELIQEAERRNPPDTAREDQR